MTSKEFDLVYDALARRSPQFDGIYFTGVKTTKIFCRPTCPAKTPLQKNVEFFSTTKAALHAGYRACKRCKPLEMGSETPDWCAFLMRELESKPAKRIRDQDLRNMNLVPATVRRVWIQRYGYSFHEYQRAIRMGVALGAFREGKDLTDAAIMTDYESESGFRAAFEKIVGVPPSRAEDANPALSRWIETELGPLFAIDVDGKLALLEFIDRRMLETQLKIFQQRFQRRVIPGNSAILEQIHQEIEEYLSGKRQRFETPLDMRGTSFQLLVWQALMTIPYGKTWSYLQLAEKIGDRNATRAVAKSNGDNRLAIIIPCHRVIGADGSLTGYGGGLWRKKRLLEIEAGGNLFD